MSQVQTCWGTQDISIHTPGCPAPRLVPAFLFHLWPILSHGCGSINRAQRQGDPGLRGLLCLMSMPGSWWNRLLSKEMSLHGGTKVLL